MNRSAFLRNVGIIAGTTFTLPTSIFSHSEKTYNSNSINSFKGFEPVIHKTPWGQKVIYDRFTYVDMMVGEWLKKDDSWKIIEHKKLELNAKIDNNEIKFSEGPVRLTSGLWKLELDGQQNIFLIKSNAGLILVDPGMESNTKTLLEQIEKLGFKQSYIKHILLSHCHVDHSHSASYWQKRGAKIHIHQLGENPIRKGNEITAWYLIDGDERIFPKVEGDISVFQDGDCLDFDDLKI